MRWFGTLDALFVLADRTIRVSRPHWARPVSIVQLAHTENPASLLTATESAWSNTGSDSPQRPIDLVFGAPWASVDWLPFSPGAARAPRLGANDYAHHHEREHGLPSGSTLAALHPLRTGIVASRIGRSDLERWQALVERLGAGPGRAESLLGWASRHGKSLGISRREGYALLLEPGASVLLLLSRGSPEQIRVFPHERMTQDWPRLLSRQARIWGRRLDSLELLAVGSRSVPKDLASLADRRMVIA